MRKTVGIVIISCLVLLCGCSTRAADINSEKENHQDNKTMQITEIRGNDNSNNEKVSTDERKQLSEKDQATLNTLIAKWQAQLPNAELQWFMINCHDGKTHFEICSSGMSFNNWIRSNFNEEGWKSINDYVTDKNEQLFVVFEDADEYYMSIKKEAIYETDRFATSMIEKKPSELTGAEMQKYIVSFQDGIRQEGNDIIDCKKDMSMLLAYETRYHFENDILEDVITTYYCPDGVVTSYADYLRENGSYSAVKEIGNTIECKMSDEFLQSYMNTDMKTLFYALSEK